MPIIHDHHIKRAKSPKAAVTSYWLVDRKKLLGRCMGILSLSASLLKNDVLVRGSIRNLKVNLTC